MTKALKSVPHTKPDRRMVDIAERIVIQLEGPFGLEQFRDRCEEALRDLIKRKKHGEKPTVAAPAPEPSNVVDLMALLKTILEREGKGAEAIQNRRSRHHDT